jgi:DNA-binding GntR family transcriptional regulator
MADKKENRKPSRYRDIAAELQKQIRLGAYAVGKLLPTETELMARFAASRQTVREALRITTEQGLIVRVTTHPEGRYTYTMDMQRSLRSPL